MKLTGTIHKSSLSGKIGKAKGGSSPSDHIFAVMENSNTATDTESVIGNVSCILGSSLSFDGTRYIVTGFKPTNNTRIEIDFMRTDTSGQKFLFGSRSADRQFTLGYYSTTVAYPMFGSATGSLSDSGATANEIHTASLGQDGYYLDGECKKVFDTMNFTGIYDLYIGAANLNGSVDTRMFIGNIYAVRIYESGELVHELLPALSSEGDSGMYDILGMCFYEQVSST